VLRREGQSGVSPGARRWPRNELFLSVSEAESLARRRLPRSAFVSIQSGRERAATYLDNIAAFSEVQLVPRVLPGPLPERIQSTTVMGQAISMPVLCAPACVHGIVPDGEVAVARATAALGTTMALAALGSKPVEEVVAANPKAFFQVYWISSRDRMERIVHRAKAASAAGLIVTVDYSLSRALVDGMRPKLPKGGLTIATALKFAPAALAHPRWLASFMRSHSLPTMDVPNLTTPDGKRIAFAPAVAEWVQTPLPSWDDIAWLRECWGGPFMVKGIFHPDDARRAVDIGASAVSVSTHGGNNLDSSPASIRALPAVVDAVGGQVEILLDGGIRRGMDVVKALALGARAVMVGRPYLWALAAGAAGVEKMLEILSHGIDSTLVGLNRPSIHDLQPSDVLVPVDFAVKY
jgi:heme/flavin dehydrogenase (mycofactocin system)